MELCGVRSNEGGLPLIEKIQLKPNGIENQKKTPVLLGEVQWEIIWGYLVRDGRCPDPTGSWSVQMRVCEYICRNYTWTCIGNSEVDRRLGLIEVLLSTITWNIWRRKRRSWNILITVPEQHLERNGDPARTKADLKNPLPAVQKWDSIHQQSHLLAPVAEVPQNIYSHQNMTFKQ